LKNNGGFTLVELLISTAILGFVIVSILNGFTYQQYRSKSNLGKNLAISLAETKLEEMLKHTKTYWEDNYSLPYTQTEYIIRSGNMMLPPVESEPTNIESVMRRTTKVIDDSEYWNMLIFTVTVEYGKNASVYPFKVVLQTRKGG